MLKLTSLLIADMHAIIQNYDPIKENLSTEDFNHLKRLKRCHKILTSTQQVKSKKRNDGDPENRFISVA